MVLIADDTDILVLLMHWIPAKQCQQRITMFRPSSDTWIDLKKVLERWPSHIVENILAIHTASGCDTVSSFVGVGKTKLIKLITPENAAIFRVFYQCEEHLDRKELIACGLKIISLLYGRKGDHDYKKLRVW